MSATVEWVKRPTPTADYRARSTHRTRGIVLALIGTMAVAVASIGSLAIASGLDGDPESATGLGWVFGLNTLGLGIVKLGIATVLVGIIVRLWMRVDSVKEALPRLTGQAAEGVAAPRGDIDTPYGKATATERAPGPLLIHRMARTVWLPVLAMGAMALVAGFVVAIAWAAADAGSESARTLAAWTQGLQFLGEGLILSGISFILGTILAYLRQGGGEVQESLGVTVKTLKMPGSAKAFVAIMMAGMMLAVVQFVLYLVAIGAADDPQGFTSWAAWLGPLREAALGTLLAGIVLALYAISKVLNFQFSRIAEIIARGV